MFFESTLESVARNVGESAANVLRDKLQFKERFSQLKKYPLRGLLTLQTLAAEQLAPLCSFEEGVSRAAAVAVETFFDSIAGRTMKLLASREPHRLLGAAPNAYPLTLNDGSTRSCTRVSDTHARFVFKNDLLGPCYQLGVFHTAVRLSCEIDSTITIRQTHACDFTFDVNW
ncbi:MAG: TIGR02265 family protein [Deltaproteobacteria bacterium]|nr:TIGR02265 family protein [Deltaproteobacteria bacterium]